MKALGDLYDLGKGNVRRVSILYHAHMRILTSTRLDPDPIQIQQTQLLNHREK